MDHAAQHVVIWPLILFAVATLGLVGVMLGLPYFIGERSSDKDRLGKQPYEAGMKPTGDARMRFEAKFYLVAIIFVLFDLEVVFIFSWAIAAPDMGWTGYLAFLGFLAIVTLGLIYEWRIGALDWAPKAPRQYRLHAIEANRARNLSSPDEQDTTSQRLQSD